MHIKSWHSTKQSTASIVTALLLVLLCYQVVLADDAKSKSGVQPQLISLPSGPGSLDGLGASFEPNLNTGTASYPVKFDLPPGRNGFQPDVALSYDGGNANGPWGIGWKLNVPSICRHTDEGLPNYDDSQDRFVYSNGEKLVDLSSGDYRFENESSFMRFRRSNDGGWEAWATDGTRFLFGETEGSREVNPYGIFCWKLARQIDTHNNEIQYSYLRDASYLYLREIRYNVAESGQSNVVLFNYNSRTDIFVDRRSRAPVAIALRADEIQIWAQGHFLRSYKFGFESPLSLAQRTESASSGATGQVDHSLLTTITQIGNDGVSILPATTFTYSTFDPASYQVVSMQDPPPIGLTNGDADLVDINADGLPDVVWTPNGSHRYYLNIGNGRWQAAPVYPTQSPADRLSSPNVRMADINGDGQVDLLVKAGSAVGAPFYYYARKPNKQWEASDRVDFNVTPSFAVDDPNMRMLDMNNDKRVDFMLTTNERYYVWLAHEDDTWSTRADFVVPARAAGSSLIFSNPRFKLGDMTGDRLQDLVFVRNGQVVYFPSNGNADYGDAVIMGNPPFNLGMLDAQIQLGDINNDGLDDLILAGNSSVRYWLNLGNNHFDTPIDLAGTPAYNQSDTAIRLADIDGDGASELLFSRYPANEQEIMQYVDFFTGTQPFLLQTIDNGLGRTIHIDYKSSTDYYVADWNHGNAWTTTLPFPVQVVSRVTVHDANSGDNYTIDYTYRDGYYDGVQKEFRGFARSEEIRQGDTSAATTVTRYLYDTGVEQESRKGLVLEKEVLGEGGSCADSFDGCYQRQINNLTTRWLYEDYVEHGVAYSFVSQTDTLIHENQHESVQLRQEFDRDGYGNLTKELNYGQVCASGDRLDIASGDRLDIACGNDELLKYTDYAINTERWIINTPAVITQTDVAGNVVSLARLYYDGDPYVGLPLHTVARGNLTRQEETLGPLGDNRFIPTKRQAFDRYGNTVGIMDANDHLTTVGYDDLTHTFPVTESIHLDAGHALTYTAAYDIGFGKIISATEFNGNTTFFTYDTFGRIASIVLPGDTVNLPTQQFSYDLGSPRSSITTHQREQSGTENVYTSVVYFDGLGRKLQTRSEAENGQVVVADAMTFNARQSEHDQFLPYFDGDFAYQPPDPTFPHASKEYDPLARVVRTINPDGWYASIEFQPLVQIQSDEEDNHPDSPYVDTPKTLRYDGLERLVEVVETNRVSDRVESYHTTYDYDTLGNLTMITDSQENTKTMQYDALSRKVFMDDPDRGEMYYVYDDVGNLWQTTDAKKQVIRYTYDAANRPLIEQWPTDNGGFETVFTYHYDDALSTLHSDARNTLGQVTYVEDLEGAVYFSYDERGNIAGRIRSFTKEGFSFVTRMRYDAMDRLSELTYPDGYTVTYHYNDQNLLETIPGYVTNVDYTPSGQRSTIVYNNGVTTQYDYDIRLRLKHLQSTAEENVLQDLGYEFDRTSNIVSIEDGRPSGVRTDANDQTQRFGYDSLYRLTQANGKYGQIDYAYDSIGNLMRQTGTVSDPRLNLGEMRYGKDNVRPHALTFAGGNTYRYDANGNQLGKGKAVYTWNPLDWLVSVDNSDAYSIYAYDADGQRIRQAVRQGDIFTTTLYPSQYAEVHGDQFIRYVLDNKQRIAQITNSFDKAHMLHGFSDSFTLSLTTSEKMTTNTVWYLTDHLGGTNLLINESSQPVSEVAYYAYGLTRYELNGVKARYQFTDKELDYSGLYYFGSRFYDPTLMRFVSVDPSNTKDAASYIYANSNPLRYVDTSGRDAEVRTTAAKALTGREYKQESIESLRTANTPEALKYLDCSELVARVLASDHLTENVKSMNTEKLKLFLSDNGKFAHSMTTPQVGDIALWKGHTGIVTGVEGEKFRLTHASGRGKLSNENRYAVDAKIYRNSEFYGFYRPIDESTRTSSRLSDEQITTSRDPFQPQVNTSTVSLQPRTETTTTSP